MKRYVKMIRVNDYIEEYGDDCIDIGVHHVVIGVCEEEESCKYEESAICGWMFEDGTCMVVGCRTDYKCDFTDMIDMIENELDAIEQSW